MKLKYIIYFGIASAILTACNNGPKVITSEENATPSLTNSGIFSEANETEVSLPGQGNDFTENLHSVVVTKVLPTSKYVYLNVT